MRPAPALLAALAFLLAPGFAMAAETLVLAPYPSQAPWREAPATDPAVRTFTATGRPPAPGDDVLTARTFPGKTAADARPVLLTVLEGLDRRCNGLSVNGPTPRTENGHQVLYVQAYCGRVSGQAFGVQLHIKLLVGEEGLYLVQREVRVPGSDTPGILSFEPDQKDEAAALMKSVSETNAYLVEGVFLCGGGGDKSCPDPR